MISEKSLRSKQIDSLSDGVDTLYMELVEVGLDPFEAMELAELTVLAEHCNKGSAVRPIVVPAVEVCRYDRAHVFFDCPKCGKRNIHSWPIGEDGRGHRWSHCQCWPRGYWIYMRREW
jgi:hypothetical protein